MFFNKPDLTNLPAYEEPEEAMSPASFSEAWKTADQAWKSDFYVSQHFNLYDAYAEHNKRVKELTGKDLQNPEDYNSRILDVDQRQELSKAFDSYKSEGGDMGFDWFQHKWYEDDYRKKLDELKAEFPDKAGEILPETSFRSQAFQRRRDYVSERAAVEERSQFLQNPLGWAGRIAGGLTSMRYDPTFYFTLPFGFGAGTGARAVLMAGAKNGAVNAVTELGAQFAPGGVMEQNRAAGIDYTATDALKVAGFAGLAGFGLDVGVRSGYRGIRTAFGHVPVVKDGIVVGWRAKGAHAKVEPLDHVPEVPADLKERAASGDKAAQEEVNRIIESGKPKEEPTISNETMAKAVEGDSQALREVYAEGAKSDPVTRAMVEAMEADDRLAVKPLDTIDDVTHAETVTQAIRHVDNPEAEPFPVRVDEAPQVPGVSDKINAEIARLKAEIATKPDNVELRSQVMELEAQIKAIDSFGSDPVGDALRLRDNPALLTTDVDTSLPGVRQTRALASLSREAFDMVQGGRATPELGQLVADYVAKPEMQAPILADLVKMRPVSALEGRRMVNELLRSPEYQPKPEAAPGPVSEAARSPRLMDDPYGTEAKAQVQRLEQELREELEAAGRPPPDEMLATPEGQAAAITRADEALSAIRDLTGIVPPEVKVQVFSRIDDLPAPLGAKVRAANAEAYKAALDRFTNARSLDERAKARADLNAAERGEGIEGISDDLTIWIASYAMDPKGRLAHEVLHALKTTGRLSPEEIKVLSDAAVESGIWTDARKSVYEAELTGRYGKDDPARVSEILEEEAAAHYVEAAVRGELPEAPAPETVGIIERLKQLFAQIRNALIGKGFRVATGDVVDPAQEVVSALMAGRIAKAEQRADWMRQNPDAAGHMAMRAAAEKGTELPDGTKVKGVPLFAMKHQDGKPERFRLLSDRSEMVYKVDQAGDYEITNLHVEEAARGEGRASRLLDKFLVAADEANARVMLSAVALDSSSGLTQSNLVAFYKRHGFKIDRKNSAPGSPVMVREPKKPKVKGVPLYAIRAYHGSPHDFDKFSMEHIGKGEGDQAFGRGLYFADRPDVAEGYRNFLSGVIVGDRGYAARSPEEIAAKELFFARGDRNAASEAIGKKASRSPTFRSARDLLLSGQPIPEAKSTGHLYQVRINAEPEQFLDWDKPLSQQSETVRRGLDTKLSELTGKEITPEFYSSFDQSGAGVHNLFSAWSKHQQDGVAGALREAGIPGIRYLDQGSRGKGEGSYNYVVFDDSLIEITHKNGVPVQKAPAVNDLARQAQEAATSTDPVAAVQEIISRAARGEIDQDTITSAAQRVAAGIASGENPQEVIAREIAPYLTRPSEPLYAMRSTDQDSLGYYSGLLRAAKNLRQERGTPEQMLAMLKKEGGREGEIATVGLTDFLADKKSITKSEIISYLESNGVGLREVRYAGNSGLDDESPWPLDTTRIVRGAAGPAKWQPYSLDPTNPTYRETVLHLPEKAQDETKLGPAGWSDAHNANARSGDINFRSGHFPEPNIVGHMMTSTVKHEGKPTYLIDQIQSDWGQKLRDGGVRDEAKIAELRKALAKAEHEFASVTGGPYRLTSTPEFADYRLKNGPHIDRLRAELHTAEAATPGHPLVNTTDQWVNTTLRRAIRQAAEQDADYIAIPHGDTVLSYNPGNGDGMRGFYGSRTQEGIVPKNLRKILQSIDKETPSPQRIEDLETPRGVKGWNDTENMRAYPFDEANTGFTVFPLTDKVKETVIEQGQPLYAMRSESGRMKPVTPIESIDGSAPHPGLVRAYHWTPVPFEKFDFDKTNDFGVHFGSVSQAAESDRLRSEFLDRLGYDTSAPRIYPVIIDAKKVLDVPDFGRWESGDIVEWLNKHTDVKFTKEQIERFTKSDHRNAGYKEISEALDRRGYDAIRYKNENEGAGWSYVVWRKGVVHSATSDAPLFAMRTDDGRPKPGAQERAQDLDADLKDIENALKGASIDDREALQRKRAALLNTKAGEVLTDEVEAYRDARGERDPGAAFLRTLETHGQGFKGNDVATLRQMIQNEALEKMAEPIWYFRKGALTGDIRRKTNSAVAATMRDMLREAAGENTTNAAAKKFAKAWLDTAEWLRQSFNAAGGDIGKLKGWFAPQYHDADALLRAGRDEWVNYLMADGVLNRDLMVRRDGTPLNNAELKELLRDIFVTITTDGANKAEPSGYLGKGAMYKRHAEHRVLHFKNADAFMKYADTFGSGDLYAMMIGHISMMSRDIAAMRRFGANPEYVIQREMSRIRNAAAVQGTVKSIFDDLKEQVATLTASLAGEKGPIDAAIARLQGVHEKLDALRGKQRKGKAREELRSDLWNAHQELKDVLTKKDMTPEQTRIFNEIMRLSDEMTDIKSKYSVFDRTAIGRANRLLKRAEEVWKIYNGTTNSPVDNVAASLMQGTRNIVSAGTLPFASISAISDQATGYAARKFIGMPAMRQLISFVNGFTQGDRKAALAFSLGLDQAHQAFATQARYLGWINTRSLTGYLVDRTHALSLLSPMTQAAKIGFGTDFISWMADLAKRLKFESLEPWTRNMLIRHGWTADDWAKLRTVVPEDYNGLPVLTRRAIATQVGDELADKYMRTLLRERSMAVLEPTMEGRAVFVSDSRPGTIMGEIARSVAMLKSFPTSYTMLVLGRIYQSFIAGQTKQGAAYGAAILFGGMALGALVRQMKNVSQGRDPENMDPLENPTFWYRSFAQSGGFGIYGDMIGNSVNRYGGGLAETLMGPAADRVSNAFNLTFGNLQQFATDEDTNFGREAVRFAKQNTPVLPFYFRTAYERMILDEIQKAVDPGHDRAFRTKVRALKKLSGNDYYWPPGSPRPLRGPRIGAAFGSR